MGIEMFPFLCGKKVYAEDCVRNKQILMNEEADSMDRRKFLKLTGLTATTGLLCGPEETFSSTAKSIFNRFALKPVADRWGVP